MIDDNVKAMLKDEYQVPKKAETLSTSLFHFSKPSSVLVQHLETSAQAAGIPANAINWVDFIPALFSALATGNWRQLIPLLVQLGPTAWDFFEQILEIYDQPNVSAT